MERMTTTRFQVSFAVCAAVLICPAGAQRTESLDKVVIPQNRITMRDLGWPPLDVIPEDERAVTSMVVAADGTIYGGTTGYRAHLFTLKPEGALVRPMGFVPGAESIHHSLAAGGDGMIYFGTTRWNKGRADLRGKDVLEKYKDFPGGHLYRFDPAAEEKQRIRTHWADPDKECPGLTDLGIPVAGDGIHAMVAAGNKLFGVTFPNAVFFAFDLENNSVTFTEMLSEKALHENPFKSIGQYLIVDKSGNVWGTWDYGKFFKYKPSEKKLVKLQTAMPTIKGREFMNVVDAFALADDGTIYGGNTDGYLFGLDPAAETVKNLGKPVWQQGIQGLAAGKDGNLYGIAGAEGGIARMFVYRTRSNEYEHLGMIESNHPPYFNWLALEFDAMAVGHDGTIYIGENSRLAHLYIFCPW